MRESMAAMLRGVTYAASPKPKRVANNTVQYVNEAGETVTRLHHTDIVVKHLDGTYTLNSGGWRTSTTKERLNAYSPVRLGQDKGEWWLYVGAGEGWSKARVPFNDGMRVDAEGRPIGYKHSEAMLQVKDRAKLARSINQFVKLLDGAPAGELFPSAGDCILCMVDRQSIKGGGNGWNSNNADTAPGGDTGHLLEHIREGYVHGTLIVNALQWAGYKDPMMILQYDARSKDRSLLKRALRRYLRRRLGLG